MRRGAGVQGQWRCGVRKRAQPLFEELKRPIGRSNGDAVLEEVKGVPEKRSEEVEEEGSRCNGCSRHASMGLGMLLLVFEGYFFYM